MADKRYPEQAGTDGALEALMKKIITSHGPKASSATVCCTHLHFYLAFTYDYNFLHFFSRFYWLIFLLVFFSINKCLQVADSSGIYGKLTDTNLYTGAHKVLTLFILFIFICFSSPLFFSFLIYFKERFNADGSGKGLEGRDKISKGTGSSRGANITPLQVDYHDESPPISDDEESNEVLANEVAKLGMLLPLLLLFSLIVRSSASIMYIRYQ